MTRLDDEALLDRWRPFVCYDSRQSYRADSPAVLTNMRVRGEGGYCNFLRRADGVLLAVADPDQYEEAYPQLTLDFLGVDAYGDESSFAAGDTVDARGTQHELNARLMHRDPALANRAYGRVVDDKLDS